MKTKVWDNFSLIKGQCSHVGCVVGWGHNSVVEGVTCSFYDEEDGVGLKYFYIFSFSIKLTNCVAGG